MVQFDGRASVGRRKNTHRTKTIWNKTMSPARSKDLNMGNVKTRRSREREGSTESMLEKRTTDEGGRASRMLRNRRSKSLKQLKVNENKNKSRCMLTN